MLYVAYGSNMDWEQTRKRCPTSLCVCKAKLQGYCLVFPRRSIRWGCGVASVEHSADSNVWGVVYEIDKLDIGELDRYEGYDPNRPAQKNSYCRKEIRVLRDGDERRQLTVWIYLGYPETNPPLPSAAYKKVIVDAAKHWQLPTDYIANLESIETKG